MRESVNYGLKIMEGSDVVNPLTIDASNYEEIDRIMHENASACIPIATELLSGTVHALTRANPNAPMFRFVATSEFKTGDTFTVDGVQVTALLTTGEPLKSGAYVINSNVLCCLVGTVLTMFCGVNLREVHAVDSDKLGGNDPSHYATATSVTLAINTAQSANEIALANKTDVEDLKTKTSGKRQSVPVTISNLGSGDIYISKGGLGYCGLRLSVKLASTLAKGATIIIGQIDDETAYPAGRGDYCLCGSGGVNARLTIETSGAIKLTNLHTGEISTSSYFTHNCIYFNAA